MAMQRGQCWRWCLEKGHHVAVSRWHCLGTATGTEGTEEACQGLVTGPLSGSGQASVPRCPCPPSRPATLWLPSHEVILI